jgi:hypothetical protein
MAAVLGITLPRRPHLLCIVFLMASGFALVSRVLVVLRLVMFLSGAFGHFPLSLVVDQTVGIPTTWGLPA